MHTTCNVTITHSTKPEKPSIFLQTGTNTIPNTINFEIVFDFHIGNARFTIRDTDFASVFVVSETLHATFLLNRTI